MSARGWYGFDLDGTLAEHVSGSADKIGRPIPAMVARLKAHLAAGDRVKIFTARVSGLLSSSPQDRLEAVAQQLMIQDWCRNHLGESLDVTCAKDYLMICAYDDRAISVECDTGRVTTAPLTRDEAAVVRYLVDGAAHPYACDPLKDIYEPDEPYEAVRAAAAKLRKVW